MTSTVKRVDADSSPRPWDPGQPHHELASDVRWWMGTPLAFGLFGRLALDQVAYRKVAAAVDASGRFAANFTDRGINSYLWNGPLAFADEADRRATAERLKTKHGAVHGVGKGDFAGERFSALDPALWKWVGTTSLNIFYAGYTAVYGKHFSDEQREVVWRTVCAMADVGLPSDAADVPATVAEMQAYYDEIADTELAANPFLLWAADQFAGPPVPTLFGPAWLHRLIEPGWRLTVPVLARPARICAESATHPVMMELLGSEWNSAKQLEFALYRVVICAARRRLPKWLVLEPMAYNRYRYEKLRDFHNRYELESFAAR
ncbi:MAG: oxygenase MpaB family protein [Mycolicibacterium neoaurum]|uniref:oxygenase MpaB family protein n=1 Tax=Mycolicibacterium neoaurum TaxID=1795 RepID=UPI002FF604E4